ncbi:alpha/beta fold hydrolase [Nisaea acidiphila]|uniref:Alpha/beta fold hydrolase n=1 Tax=Nisaea acidiphila TaxID=1862145 RepID=A0A9J7AVT6_9PROT|nr:alpha/beta fold hydrolase [Nisaea acidiphila]UUX50396.1 alpha/beta fold hydrolase [Nisaea acidiphila]
MLPDKPAYPPFRAGMPWVGGDLQTLRSFVVGGTPRIDSVRSERLDFPMEDGSGDRLSGVLEIPATPVEGAPLVVLIHGLTGCEDSFHMRDAARYFVSAGLRVLRLNLRGAGPTRAACTHAYHAGRSDDLAAVLAQLRAHGIADRFVLFGVSLGANMMLKYLGERPTPDIVAAVSISAPLDLARTSERFIQPRNRFYHRWLLKNMKLQALATPGLSARELSAIRSARTTVEYDERHIAARNGFESARDYYAKCSAKGFLRGISVPTLVVHALNDPWIPGGIYLDVDWAASPSLTPLLPLDGGHVGFHDRGGSWHLRMAERFLEEKRAIPAH